VEELQEIGFKFEHDTIQKAIDYMKEFIKNNRAEIVPVILPDFDVTEFEELTEINDVLTHLVTSEIVERLLRLKKGIIERSDYYFQIHPKYKNDLDVLINLWRKKFIKYSIDSMLVMYDQTFVSIAEDEAMNLVFYNELLRYLILKLPKKEFKEREDNFKDLNAQLEYWYSYHKSLQYRRDGKGVFLFYGLCHHNIQMCTDLKYERIFSQNQTVEQKAVRIYYKMQEHTRPYKLHECTSIQEKEAVLRYYLKKQSEKVIKSKNTRGTGRNKSKADKIVEYAKNNPTASIKQVADALGVNWRTAKKYMG
jgi:hypothetical protein